MISIGRTLRSALTAATIAALFAGCAATRSPSDAPASASATVLNPTVAPTGPFALRAGTLPPGRYTTTAFQPTLAFTIDAGWNGMFPDDDDEVALEGRDRIFTIGRVSKMVDPATGTAVAVPDDLVAWLATHPKLTAEAPEPVTNSGLAGQRVDVTVTAGSELGIFAYPTGNFRIPPGFTYRCYVLPLDGPDMVIVIGAPTAAFAKTVEEFQAVLDSLVIDSGG